MTLFKLDLTASRRAHETVLASHGRYFHRYSDPGCGGTDVAG